MICAVPVVVLCRPETFDLATTAIEQAYRSKQKLVHPDKFGNRSEVQSPTCKPLCEFTLVHVWVHTLRWRRHAWLPCFYLSSGWRVQEERQISSKRSAELNIAYEVLKNPVSRAQHLVRGV